MRTNLVGEIVQGVIALVIVVGAFLLGGYALSRGDPPSVSIAIVAMAVGPIVGFYFGRGSAIAGMIQATNGMTDAAIRMATQRQQAEVASPHENRAA